MLFIKGLDLYGKAWKKIAGIIKTRTVVQIRTHAQKYFLKMAKVRHSGESTGASSSSVSVRVSHRVSFVLSCLEASVFSNAVNGFWAQKRHRKRPVAIAPVLIPFVKPVDEFDSTADPYSTLYHFLSPRIGTVLTQTSALVVPVDGDGAEKHPSGESLPMVRYATERTQLTSDDLILPPWYSKRESIESLLQIAESLDWTEDHGGALHCPPDNCGYGSTAYGDYPNSPLTSAVSSLTASGEEDHLHPVKDEEGRLLYPVRAGQSLDALFSNPEFIEAMWTQRMHLATGSIGGDACSDLNTVRCNECLHSARDAEF
jgi:SHAQKYF class myb-like DNA-binding protein